MVSKQSASSAEKKKIPPRANESWMSEFSADMAADGMDDSDSNTEFSKLFEQQTQEQEMAEGQVVEGKVVNVGPDHVTVDVGFKCEGQVPLYEFKDATGTANVAVGDIIGGVDHLVHLALHAL